MNNASFRSMVWVKWIVGLNSTNWGLLGEWLGDLRGDLSVSVDEEVTYI